jgi:predicted hotdog family 3-hydroxylacyl-ACP dehydratase
MLMLDHAALAVLIPHGEAMCLLHGVVAWDDERIHCVAVSHRHAGNPLIERAAGQVVCLPVWAGIEYAAQAAAVHGALANARATPRPGVLAALRNVAAHCERLDDIDGELQVTATARHRDPAGAVYGFQLMAGDRLLISGQFTLMHTAA